LVGPTASSQNSDLEDDDLDDPSEDTSLIALKRKIEVLSPGSENERWVEEVEAHPGSVENGVM